MAHDEYKVEALCREILDTVLADIRQRYQYLPSSLKAVADETQATYEESAARLRAEFARDDERQRTRALSQATFKARRSVLDSRDACVSAWLTAGRNEALARWRAGDDSSLALAVELAVEGIAELPGDRFVVRADLPLPPEFTERVVAAVLEADGRSIRVDLEQDEALEPGLVVTCPNGLALYDNRLCDRFRRIESNLRTELTRMLTEEVESHREGP